MKEFEIAFKGIIRKRDKILMLKRSKSQKVAPGQWDTPGGKMHFGENIEQSFKRELLEEIGTNNVRIAEVLNVWSFMKGRKTQLIGITFLCSYKGGKIILSSEHSEFKWVDPEIFIGTIKTEKELKRTLRSYLKKCRKLI